MAEVKEKLLMEQVSNQALFEKLQTVEALLLQQQKSALNDESKELWTVADIAVYFKLSERHIRGAVIVDPLFPRPVEIPSQRDCRRCGAVCGAEEGEESLTVLCYRVRIAALTFQKRCPLR